MNNEEPTIAMNADEQALDAALAQALAHRTCQLGFATTSMLR